MSTQPIPRTGNDQPPDDELDTISTPEGDNESPPDAPLRPRAPAVVRPRGDTPHTTEPLYPAT